MHRLLLLVVFSIALWIPTIKAGYCFATDIQYPGLLRNVRRLYRNGESFAPTCGDGYQLAKPNSTITCRDGKWEGDTDPCVEGYCFSTDVKYPGVLRNVRRLYRNGESFVPTCGDGFKLAKPNSLFTCRDGKWEGDADPCIEGQCTIPYISGGKLGKYEPWGPNRRLIEERVFVPSDMDLKVNPGQAFILKCDDGYSIGGKRESEDSVICQDGTWSQDLQCVSMSCEGPLPAVQNAYVISVGKNDGDTATYACRFSFRKIVFESVRCQQGVWVGNLPVCEDARCQVDQLYYPGFVKPDQKIYNFGASFPVACENGYELARPNARFTCSTGQWRGPVPPCIRANDESLIEEEDSMLQNFPFIKPIFEPEDVIVKTTKSSLPPPIERDSEELEFLEIPQATGDGPEIIEDQTCFCTYDNLDSEVVAFYDGHELIYGDRVKMGGSVKFHCRQLGYKRLHGPQEILCRTCKTWVDDDFPNCLYPEPGDTTITLDETKVQILPGGIVGIQVDDTVEFSCYGSGNYDMPKWYYHGPAMPSRISMTRDFVKGYIDASMRISRVGPEHEGIYKCGIPSQRGYLMRVKILGIACPDLGDIEDMDISYSDGQRVGSKATFRCRPPGTLIGPSEIQCQKNGTWSRSLPLCIKNEEPVSKEGDYSDSDFLAIESSETDAATEETTTRSLPASSAGRDAGSETVEKPRDPEAVSETTDDLPCSCIYSNPDRRIAAFSDGHRLNFGDQVKEGHSVTFLCEGRHLRGPSEIFCRSCEKWFQEDFPTCQLPFRRNICPDLGVIEGMEISYTNGQRLGSIATFQCTPPGTLTGPSEIRCRKGGRWNHSLPSCQSPECSIDSLFSAVPSNVVPEEEDVTGEFVPYESTVRLTCVNNLKLLGNPVATCGRRGRWETKDIQCISGCAAFVKPPLSEVMIEPQKDFYRFGEFVLFSCPFGFSLTPNIQRVMCLGNSWSEKKIPECELTS